MGNMKLKLSRIELPFDFEVQGKDESFIYRQPSTKQIKKISKNSSVRIRDIEELLRKNIRHANGDEEKVEQLFDELEENYNMFDVKIELDSMLGNFARSSSSSSTSGQNKTGEEKENSPTP